MISLHTLVLHATVSALDPEALHTQTEQSVRALLKEGDEGSHEPDQSSKCGDIPAVLSDRRRAVECRSQSVE
jgi:hypothetical protein